MYFEESVYLLTTVTKIKSEVRYFVYVKNIHDMLENHLDDTILSMKIALVNDILKNSNGKEYKVSNYVTACDRNLNCITFSIKEKTLSKWRNDLKARLADFAQVEFTTKIDAPVGLGDCSI